MPYSVSVPITRRTLILAAYRPKGGRRGDGQSAPRKGGSGGDGPSPPGEQTPLKVLPGVRYRVDRAPGLGAGLAGDQGPDVDDALALLTGDAGPVVRVGGVRQVLVLAELIDARVQQVG